MFINFIVSKTKTPIKALNFSRTQTQLQFQDWLKKNAPLFCKSVLLDYFPFYFVYKNLLISKCSYKDTSRVSSIPQLTGQHRWHTLVALPGQHNLVRRDLYGLRPTPLGQSNAKFPARRYSQESEEQSQQNSPRRPLVVPNLRRPPIPPPYPRQGCQRLLG